MGSTPAGRMFAGDPLSVIGKNSAPPVTVHQSLITAIFETRKFPLTQRFDAIQQILLARNSCDLVAQLTILEKKQSRNRANVVFE